MSAKKQRNRRKEAVRKAKKRLQTIGVTVRMVSFIMPGYKNSQFGHSEEELGTDSNGDFIITHKYHFFRRQRATPPKARRQPAGEELPKIDWNMIAKQANEADKQASYIGQVRQHFQAQRKRQKVIRRR